MNVILQKETRLQTETSNERDLYTGKAPAICSSSPVLDSVSVSILNT